MLKNESLKLEIPMSVEELADSVTGRDIRIMQEIEKNFEIASTNFSINEISRAFVKSICFDLVIGDRETLRNGQEFVNDLDRLAKGVYPPQFKLPREEKTYLTVQCQKILNWMESKFMIKVA